MQKILYVYDDIFLEHDTGSHPENSMRLEAINKGLNGSDFLEYVEKIKPDLATSQDVQRIHTQEYISRVEKIIASGATYLDPDTVVCDKSIEAAFKAVGSGIKAADKIMTQNYNRAFCAVRPPGHHAESDRSMGFCIFNNIAITAKYLQQNYNIGKILILDWDVHHGNSTEKCFYDDPSVFFISLHQHPFYPGTGDRFRNGNGAGVNYNLNLPMRAGAGNHEYLTALNEAVLPAIKTFAPEFILISTGYDAHFDDPLASINLDDKMFAKLTELTIQQAESAQGRIISFLEGGYNLNVLSRCVPEHLKLLIEK